jgi:peptidoglycan/xylan/chitin deacetylase (PgdA/CDA1 family)
LSDDLADMKTLGLQDHYRPRRYAAVWKEPPTDWTNRLSDALERGSANQAPTVFFRADDVGAGGQAFEALCILFRSFQVPLAMAVVPSWLSSVRQKQLFESAPLSEKLWGWHQHGWRHVNWQKTGKKSEFGEHRPFERQWRDIWQGQQKMKEIFGDNLLPIFTPPWNRMSNATLKVLQELNFKGISLAGSTPRGFRPPPTLKKIRVHLDLHTRKGRDGDSDFDGLLEELAILIGRREPFGVMIHHHRMTAFAFQFLHALLYFLRQRVHAQFLSFKEILEKPDEE